MASYSTQTPLSYVNFKYTSEEIKIALNEVKAAHAQALASLVKADGERSFENTYQVLAAADGIAALAAAQMSLPALVSNDSSARTASSTAKEALRTMFTEAYARDDLYHALETASVNCPSTSATQFVAKTLSAFRRNGCGLPPEVKEKVAALSAEEARIAGEFEQNLNEDVSTIVLTSDELQGLGKGFLASLVPDDKDPSLFRMGLKVPQRVPYLQQAEDPSGRQCVLTASDNVATDKNTSLLERLVTVRHERAVLLGYSSHAHYRLAEAMAATPAAVESFLRDLATRLAPRRQTDIADLLKLKEEDCEARSIPFDGVLNAWDVPFYSQKLIKQRYGVDQEALRKWFPLTHVRNAMFRAYEDMLGLKFHPIPADQAPPNVIWHDTAELFAVTDSASGDLVGHFLMDLFSRPGKYSHQCVVPLAPCHEASVQLPPDSPLVSLPFPGRPICAILGNLSPPTDTQPSLLLPSEVETMFHEFGHVMHALCTSVPYSRLSWTWPLMPWPGGVEQDFLEVPSMALEQFVYDAPVIRRLAHLYADGGSNEEEGATLDDDTIQRLASVRFACAGLTYTRLVAMSLYDLLIHSSPPPYTYNGQQGLDLKALWHALMDDVVGYPPTPGTFMPASWYHMVTGYDAGYYGYLWSDVLAVDVLSQFEAKGDLLDPTLGKKFRDILLAPCASRLGADMVEAFLGRPPSQDAFFHLLGITQN